MSSLEIVSGLDLSQPIFSPHPSLTHPPSHPPITDTPTQSSSDLVLGEKKKKKKSTVAFMLLFNYVKSVIF